MKKRTALFAALCMVAPSLSARAQAPEAAPDSAPVPAEGQAQAPASQSEAASAEAPAVDPSLSAEGAADPQALSAEAAAAGYPEAAGAEIPLSQAELEALGFSTSEGGEVQTLDTSLRVSGFMDFNYSRLIAAKDSLNRSLLPRNGNLYIGNFNVYLTKNLSEKFRTMGEVRFSYAPNGGLGVNPVGGTPTTEAKDYADFDRASMKWGGIEIERVYLEYTAHRLLSIRGGQFLTPYGIWNVDHGSPTFIPVQRPYVVGNGLFPERQTGFEAFGRWDATNSGTLGYHLTISNGSGPISEFRDLDNNKAVGGRLFWEQRGFGELRLGASAYYGKDTDATSTFTADATGKLKPAEIIHRQYDVLALAVDAVWKYKGLHLQAEYITQQRNYTSEGRQAAVNSITQQTVFPADANNWGAYGLVGYRLPWYGVMPYVIVSHINLLDPAGIMAKNTGANFGLNIRPIDSVVFKIEYLHAIMHEKLLGGDEPFRIIQSQIAWAF